MMHGIDTESGMKAKRGGGRLLKSNKSSQSLDLCLLMYGWCMHAKLEHWIHECNGIKSYILNTENKNLNWCQS